MTFFTATQLLTMFYYLFIFSIKSSRAEVFHDVNKKVNIFCHLFLDGFRVSREKFQHVKRDCQDEEMKTGKFV